MSFLNNLFDATGCNPDGSLGQNAFTSFVDQTLNSHLFADENGSDFDQVPTYFLPEQEYDEGESQGQAAAPMSSYISQGGFMPMSSPMMMGMPSMMGMPPMMRMAPGWGFPQPMMMNYPMMGGNAPFMQNQMHQQQQEFDDEQDVENIEEAQDDTQETIVEGEEEFECSFENITTYPVDQFAPLSAWSAQQAAGSQFEGGSKEELDKAWDEVQQRLEQGSDAKHYLYQTNNPYLHQQANNSSTTDSAATTTAQAHTIDNNDYDAEMMQRGKDAFEKGQLTQAMQIFEAIVQQSQYEVDHSEAWYYLGQCHSENDDELQAIQAYEHAQELDPYHLDTLLALSVCYVNELHSVKALETLQQWIQQNPKFMGLQIQPDAYSDGTMLDEVQHFLLTSLQHAPQDMELRTLLGIVSHLSMEYDSAEHYFRHVLTQKPNDYSILNKLGATLANNNRNQKSLPYYIQALQQRPKYARAWRNIGVAYSNLNQYDHAAKAYIQTLHLSPKASHIWGYLRVVLSCLERMDLVELSAKEDVQALANALDVRLL